MEEGNASQEKGEVIPEVYNFTFVYLLGINGGENTSTTYNSLANYLLPRMERHQK
jgi:hypothetical protein